MQYLISVLGGRISMKLDTNIRHMSVNCYNGFQGQRSRSYVYRCVNAIQVEAYISTIWHRGSLIIIRIEYELT